MSDSSENHADEKKLNKETVLEFLDTKAKKSHTN